MANNNIAGNAAKLRDFVRQYGADANPLLINVPKSSRNPLTGAFEELYRSGAARDAMANQLLESKGALSAEDILSKQASHMNSPLNVKTGGLKNTAGLLGANIKAHPWITAGTALNAGGNVAGLFDNDKVLGQLAGTVAGVALPKVFGLGLGTLGAANAAMLGGNLGALFDNLRAKREQEQASQLPAEYTTY